jgi:glycosyltransferase involved in cell wall biosynthesis
VATPLLAVGLIAPLPPQVGGVASVAAWLLAHEKEIGASYSTFDLRRPTEEVMGGPLRLSGVPRQARQLVRFLRWLPGSPSLVHYCVSMSKAGLPRDALYILLLRLAGRRTIAHVHGSALPLAVNAPVRSRLLKLIGRATSERVAISPTSARTLESAGVSSHCILNPIRFSPDTLPARVGDDGPVKLLFVGAYGRRKGCPELIDALALARTEGVDATLQIVGNEDQEGDGDLVLAKIAAHDLHSVVEFAGVKTESEMPAAYESADLVCLPSRFEGLPMALLEAMAFGLPVVATPVGGVADLVISGETGLLVTPGDVEELAQAIIRLASDHHLRRHMGVRGRERVLELAGAPVITSEWRSLYGELSSGQGR